uniref:Uncharacterized protein n=1 Tax=Romanomermis culicivorax TaxID=13658 RepID=A0A915IAA0_ROMCU
MQCHSKEKGLSSQRRDIANSLADMATEYKKVFVQKSYAILYKSKTLFNSFIKRHKFCSSVL